MRAISSKHPAVNIHYINTGKKELWIETQLEAEERFL